MSNVIIITEPKNKNGNYEFTEEKLRDLIQDAYNKGYTDGQAKPKFELQPRTNYPGNSGTGTGIEKQPNISDPFWYERNPTPWWGEVTCKNLSANSSVEPKVEEVQVGEQIPIPGLEDL